MMKAETETGTKEKELNAARERTPVLDQTMIDTPQGRFPKWFIEQFQYCSKHLLWHRKDNSCTRCVQDSFADEKENKIMTNVSTVAEVTEPSEVVTKLTKKQRKQLKKEMKQKASEVRAALQLQTSLNGEWTFITNGVCPICNEPENVYRYDDKVTCYCLACESDLDFHEVLIGESDVDGDGDESNGEDLSVPGELTSVDNGATATQTEKAFITDSKFGQYQMPGWSKFNSPVCKHNPQMLIRDENETLGSLLVWAGKKEDCSWRANEFDVVINLTFNSIQDHHIIPIPELREYENWSNYVEVRLDWPDYGVLPFPRIFWEKLVAHLRQGNKKTLVFCMGGHGRTGTVMAALMVVGLGYTAEEAIGWIRQNYCKNAVETKGQESYVKGLERVRIEEKENE